MAAWGFALRRNNSCTNDETDCGATWSSWRACCSKSTVCPRNPGGKYSVCCPYEGDGCYDFVANSDPQCPEESASVFHDEQHNATICCADNTVGFYLEKYGYVGCAENMALARSSNENYTLVEMDRLSTATTSSTTTSATSTNSASAGATNHSTNTGAIAGGVVGGVCGVILLLGLAWWFLRNRKKTKWHDHDQEDAQLSDDGSQGRHPGFNKQKTPRELDPGQGVLPVKELEDNPVGEMDAGQDAMRAKELEDPKGGVVKVLPELDGQKRSAAVELPS